jgi:predicted nucleic acid-binding protein
VQIDVPLERVAWGIFVRHDDKTHSFTDCASFAVMRQMDIHQAFAFDHHFVQAGFALLPPRSE